MAGQAPGGPVVAPLPPQLPAADVAGLTVQVIDLHVQLSGLQAQWNSLRTQLDAMLQNNPARPGVQQKWADVGVQIAQVKGDIARLEGRIAQLQGNPVGTTAPPPGRFPRPFNSNAALPVGAVLLLVLGLPVSIAWARRLLRGDSRPAPYPQEQAMRLERMEHAIEAVAIEVERIAEGQRFVTKIMTERPAEGAAAQRSSAAAQSDVPPPRALGAGPVEPIRVAEREEVRVRRD